MTSLVTPACDRLCVDELRRRTVANGTRKRTAHEFGVSRSRLSAYFRGIETVPEYLAWRILDRVRKEDLELADKIEAELLSGSPWKEER